MIKVLIVDDNEMFRTPLKSFLQENIEIVVVGIVENGLEALSLIKGGIIPDIVLFDFEIPYYNNLRSLMEIKKINKDIGIIILSKHFDFKLPEDLKNISINGFVSKDQTTDILLDAIYNVKNGSQYFEQTVYKKNNLNEAIVSAIRLQYCISDRKFEILVYVCKGLRAKEIADILYITERTVETHKTSIFKKTSTTSNMELMLFAVNHGIVSKN